MFDFLAIIVGERIAGFLCYGFFYLLNTIGILLIKIFTLSRKPIPVLRAQYKDSSKPWFLGFGLMGAMIFFLGKL